MLRMCDDVTRKCESCRAQHTHTAQKPSKKKTRERFPNSTHSTQLCVVCTFEVRLRCAKRHRAVGQRTLRLFSQEWRYMTQIQTRKKKLVWRGRHTVLPRFYNTILLTLCVHVLLHEGFLSVSLFPYYYLSLPRCVFTSSISSQGRPFLAHSFPGHWPPPPPRATLTHIFIYTHTERSHRRSFVPRVLQGNTLGFFSVSISLTH